MSKITYTGKGRSPFGYEYFPETKELKVKKKEAEAVKLIAKRALQSKSLRQISDELNELGYETQKGGKWYYKLLTYILDDKRLLFYAGYTPDMETGNWKSILPLKLAKELIAKEVIKTVGSRPRVNVFLLPGLDIARCGHCGSSIRAQYGTHEPRYYYCSGRSLRGEDFCPNAKMINMEEVNKTVITDLIVQANRAEQISKWIKKFNERREAKLRTEIEAADKELHKYFAKSASEKDKDKEAELELKIDSLKKTIKNMYKEISDPFSPQYFVDDKIKKYNTFSTGKQKELIPKYLQEIILTKNEVRLVYRFPIDSKLNSTKTIKI